MPYTINHTLLTIKQAEDYGLKVKGLVFNSPKNEEIGIAEQTNPQEIKKLSKIEVLGMIPYFKENRYSEIVGSVRVC